MLQYVFVDKLNILTACIASKPSTVHLRSGDAEQVSSASHSGKSLYLPMCDAKVSLDSIRNFSLLAIR